MPSDTPSQTDSTQTTLDRTTPTQTTSTRATRRRFLRVAGVAGLTATLSAGCATRRTDTVGAATDTATATDTTTATETPTATPVALPERTVADPPGGPESYPERPDRDTAAAATAFVRAFEYAQGYNRLYESDAETVSVNATARHVRAVSAGGYYVLGRRGGYANYADGVHADLGTVPRLYFVSPRYAVRVANVNDRLRDCETVPAAADPEDNFAAMCSGDDARFAVVNLAPEPRELVVTIRRADAGDTTADANATATDAAPDADATVVQESFRLVPGRAVVFDGVTRQRGRYRLAVTADGRETAATWDLRTGPRERPLTVVSTPRRRLTVNRFPEWPY